MGAKTSIAESCMSFVFSGIRSKAPQTNEVSHNIFLISVLGLIIGVCMCKLCVTQNTRRLFIYIRFKCSSQERIYKFTSQTSLNTLFHGGSILDRCGNDPSAGSPTETLLRLHLPLNDKVQTSSRDESENTPQSRGFTGPFNR